jgi:hypothetical protein
MCLRSLYQIAPCRRKKTVRSGAALDHGPDAIIGQRYAAGGPERVDERMRKARFVKQCFLPPNLVTP